MEIEWTLALTCVLYRENLLQAVEKQRRTLFLPWSVAKRFDASSKSGRGLQDLAECARPWTLTFVHYFPDTL
jgi:hypothetical protein